MTLSDDGINPYGSELLPNILRLIARNSDLNAVVPVVLQQARSVVHADAGFYLLFDEPRALFVDQINEDQLPSDDGLFGFVQKLPQEIHSFPDVPTHLASLYTKWLVVPLLHRRRVVAVLGLFFADTSDLTDADSETLLALAHCLSIVTNQARSEARHQKLTRNQNEFVRIVSHDLRSPLTSIRGFASMLESNSMGDLTEKQLHFVEKILSGVSQMTSLVDNIQDAGRYDPETGFYEMERSATDLTDMVRNIVKNHLMPAEKEELTLTVKISDDVPIVNVDATMLERSIINLVDNAIKYTPNGGQIEVGVRREGGQIVITISDNGYGISAENLRHLFERHFRIRRREHKRVKGSGLGLFIVRSVARHHGGDAFVESVEGQGSTFGIRIPLSGDNLLGASVQSSTTANDG